MVKNFIEDGEKMIPKIIHYCWFGGKPLPELAQKCIESWKKNCPGYEIKRWDETNFDINCCDYVREAYEAKMWAFVSDYARFKILYENGGVYFDTDVELIKPIDDIIAKGSFMGLEKSNKAYTAPGLGLAVNAGLGLAKEVLDSYHNSHFEKDENGSYETVVTRVTNIILKHGDINRDKITEIAGITIYPPEYFCPLNYYTGEMNITENTRSIHHYMASWVIPESRAILSVKKKLCSKGGIPKVIGNILVFILRAIRKIRNVGIKKSLEYIWNKIRFKIKLKASD